MKPLKLVGVLILFIMAVLLIFAAKVLAVDCGIADYAEVAGAGFSFFEALIAGGLFGSSGVAGILLLVVRSMKKSAASLTRAINTNPQIDNLQLLNHARNQGEAKAVKVLNKAFVPSGIARINIDPPPPPETRS